jgi:hypothetical protein
VDDKDGMEAFRVSFADDQKINLILNILALKRNWRCGINTLLSTQSCFYDSNCSKAKKYENLLAPLQGMPRTAE